MVKLVTIAMKWKFKSKVETGHDCYEKKVVKVMVKLVMIVMKGKLKQ
jgi:hypothetical protein